MKPRLTVMSSVLVPFSLLVGILYFQLKDQKTEMKTSEEHRLMASCVAGSETNSKSSPNKELVQAVCACFTKTILKHKSIETAALISDPEIVHSVLKNCHKLVTQK